MRQEPSLVVADAQVIVHQLLIVELQLVPEHSVDAVHGEMLAPVLAPFRPVIALHGEQQLANGVGQRAQSRRCARPCIRATA